MITPIITTSQKDPQQVEIPLLVYSLFLAFLLVAPMSLLTLKNSYPGIFWPIIYLLFVGVIWVMGTQIAQISDGKRVILRPRKKFKIEAIVSLLGAVAALVIALIFGV